MGKSDAEGGSRRERKRRWGKGGDEAGMSGMNKEG